MERKDVEYIVKATLADYHQEDLQRMARIEERIISIDGNGTGRKGAVQRLEEGINEIKTQLDELKDKISNLSTSDHGNIKKNTVIAILGSISVVILGSIATIAAGWIEHKMGWK